MTYSLTKDQALRLAQIQVVASNDAARPVLTHTEMRFEGERIVAAATDSYRLVIYVFDVEEFDDTEITVSVPAKALADAIKAVVKAAPKGFVSELLQQITLLPYHNNNEGTDQVDVSGVWPNAPVFTVTDTLQGASFPKWVQLLNGVSFNVTDHSVEQKVDADTTLPALKPQFLADIPKLMGATKALQDRMHYVQLMELPGSSGSTAGALKPWAFTAKTEGMSVMYVQMPVRR